MTTIRRQLHASGLTAALAIALVAAAASAQGFAPNQAKPFDDLVQFRLISDAEAIKPGQTFSVGVVFDIVDGWHVYWLNPGDAGMAPSLDWSLPDGVKLLDVAWPVPKRYEEPGGIVAFGYADQLVLVATLQASADIEPETNLVLKADADWLVCRDRCLPGRGSAKLALQVGQSRASAEADRASLDAWRARLPADAPARSPDGSPAGPVAAIKAAQADAEGNLRLVVLWADKPPASVDWFWHGFDGGEVENIERQTKDNMTEITATLRTYGGKPLPGKLQSVLAWTNSKGERRGLKIPIPIGAFADGKAP